MYLIGIGVPARLKKEELEFHSERETKVTSRARQHDLITDEGEERRYNVATYTCGRPTEKEVPATGEGRGGETWTRKGKSIQHIVYTSRENGGRGRKKPQ